MDIRTADEYEMSALRSMSSQEPEKLIVRFHMEADQDEAASAEAGRPIFVERPYIEIKIPGNKDEIRNRPMREGDKIRFARQWDAFKSKADQPVVGTPLSAIPFLTKSQVAEFQVFNCLTAEHVRDMPDSLAQKFMGINSIKQRVKTFLEAAAGAAPAEKLQAELAERDSKISTQEQALKAQGDMIKVLQEKMEAFQKATPAQPTRK